MDRRWWLDTILADTYTVALAVDGSPVEERLPERPSLEVGQPAPDFSFLDFEGKRRRLSDYRGKVVLLECSGGGKAASPVEGFTPEQQFFLGYAQAFCENVSGQAARLFAETGGHTLARIRINGALSNRSEFSEAFSCNAGSPMVRPAPCHIR